MSCLGKILQNPGHQGKYAKQKKGNSQLNSDIFLIRITFCVLLMLRKKFQPTSKNARMVTNHLVASIFQQGNTRFFSYKGLFKTACVIDLGFFVLSFFLDQKLRNSTSKGLRRSQMRQLTTVKCRFRVKLKS